MAQIYTRRIFVSHTYHIAIKTTPRDGVYRIPIGLVERQRQLLDVARYTAKGGLLCWAEEFQAKSVLQRISVMMSAAICVSSIYDAPRVDETVLYSVLTAVWFKHNLI